MPKSTGISPVDEALFVLGRFPPPFDGHALATQRLADLVGEAMPVHRLDIGSPASGDPRRAHGVIDKTRGYLDLRPQLAEALDGARVRSILWTSVSPKPLGHFRDLLITLPTLPTHCSVYAVVHWGNFSDLFTAIPTAITGRRLVRRISGFAFLSEALSNRCARWIPAGKRVVIPNTIDADLSFSDGELEGKRRARPAGAPLDVLFLSNMIPSKGFLDVAKALALAPESERASMRGLFVGAWPSPGRRRDFERWLADHHLAPITEVHGAVTDRREAKRMYERADVLVLPTYYPNEAQPLVILEAMNAGLPVIATRHGAIPEMIRDGQDGFLVPAHAPEAIRTALQHLKDPGRRLRMSRSARSRFQEIFSPDVVRRAWLNLLRKDDGRSRTPGDHSAEFSGTFRQALRGSPGRTAPTGSSQASA